MRIVRVFRRAHVGSDALQQASDDASVAQRLVCAETCQTDGLAGFILLVHPVEPLQGLRVVRYLAQEPWHVFVLERVVVSSTGRLLYAYVVTKQVW